MTLLSLVSWVSGHLLTEICLERKAYSWPELGNSVLGRCGEIGIEVVQVFGFVVVGVWAMVRG